MCRFAPARGDGVTLIELLIVIVVLVAAMAVAGPGLFGAHQRAKIGQTVDEFESAYSFARTLALRYGRGSELKIDSGKDAYVVTADTVAGGFKLKVGHILDDVDLSANRSYLCFDGRGMPILGDSCEPHDALVVFSTPHAADSVRITALGVIRR
jgi:prepilin-type N-terminal cleavage/methylation domain-containing protein